MTYFHDGTFEIFANAPVYLNTSQLFLQVSSQHINRHIIFFCKTFDLQ